MIYTGTTSVINGQSATLSGMLSAFGSRLPGKSVTLTLGSGGSAQSCSGTTNASGSASCFHVRQPDCPLGPGHRQLRR